MHQLGKLVIVKIDIKGKVCGGNFTLEILFDKFMRIYGDLCPIGRKNS